jgi:hypothetical protein
MSSPVFALTNGYGNMYDVFFVYMQVVFTPKCVFSSGMLLP